MLSIAITIARKLMICVLMVSLALGLPLPTYAATTGSPLPNVLEDHGGGSRDGVGIVLHAERPATPGEAVALSAEAHAFRDVASLTITWRLMDGGELLDGPTEQPFSAIHRNTAYRTQRRVRFPAPGVYRVVASVGAQPSTSERIGASSVLFFHVGLGDQARVTNRDEAARAEFRSAPSVRITTDTSSAAKLSAAGGVDGAQVNRPSDDPCFTVSGRVTRMDLPPTLSGYGASMVVPVRFAEVEIREDDLIFDDSYGSVTTDAQGNYSKRFCDDDGVFDDTLEIYVRLKGSLWANGHEVVNVSEHNSILGIDLTSVTDGYEFDSGEQSSEGGALTFDYQLQNNRTQSAVFNIADSVYEAWQFWNNSGGPQLNSTVDVLWEPGEGQAGSNYRGDIATGRDIVIADAPGDPDEWDDSVIMHETGHMYDDYFSCDDNPGGTHYVDQITDDDNERIDLELAWGEGYPDYFQSAVRKGRGDALASTYIDNDSTTNSAAIVRNLETYDTSGNPNSYYNELSIAAMLWDLNDNAADNGGSDDDRVAFGHNTVQRVYTDPAFAANGDVFDDTCTAPMFMQVWAALNLQADAAVADAVRRNVGTAFPIASRLAAAQPASAQPESSAAVNSVEASLPDLPGQPQYQWWQRHSVVVDTSASMSGAKLDVAKSVLVEQINDLTQNPKGSEIGVFRFDNTSNKIQPVVEGRFFPDQVLPSVNALSASGAADPNCPTAGLSALGQTARRQHDGQAWLITDGDDAQSMSPTSLRSQLVKRRMRGSIILLAGCGSAATKESDLGGVEKDYLGLAADGSRPNGIAPYLLTALGSGGQFLFVRQDQLADAIKILRAGLSNSAGAGRWSDYVADSVIARYDDLDPNEYHWIDTYVAGGGTYLGSTSNGSARFPWWRAPNLYRTAFEDGFFRTTYFEFNNVPIQYTDHQLMLANMPWFRWVAAPSLKPQSTDIQGVWSQCVDNSDCVSLSIKSEGGWVATTMSGVGGYTAVDDINAKIQREMQLLENISTGEVRYQYRSVVPGDSGSAYVGVGGSIGPFITIANHDVGAITNNSGYKIYQAPAQPTKTFTVAVDSLINAVGFLQTGYSGTFDRMVVRYPDGSEASCADTAQVLCISLNDGLVQYVQVDVRGRGGVYSAVVDAGSSGQGTFSFSALAASAIGADSDDARERSLLPARLTTRLGQGVDGNVLDGWLQSPNGTRLGNDFKLYDDGAHGDGAAGDGVFGSDPYSPNASGVGYMWVKGTVGGIDISRSDAVPYNFQPVRIGAAKEYENNGASTLLQYQVYNDDQVDHCFNLSVTVPPDWQVSFGLGEEQICLGAGNYGTVGAFIRMNPGPEDNTLPSGAAGDVTIVATEKYEGAIHTSATTRLVRRRYVDHVIIENPVEGDYIPVGQSRPITLTAHFFDAENEIPSFGLTVDWQASDGTLPTPSPNGSSLVDGEVQTSFTPPDIAGDYVISLTLHSFILPRTFATTTVRVRDPIANQIELSLDPSNLGDGDTAIARVTVRDPYGVPVSNAQVRVGLENDDVVGTLDSSQVLTQTTDDQGQLSVTFAKSATSALSAAIRAELLADSDQGPIVIDTDRKVLSFATSVLFIPTISR